MIKLGIIGTGRIAERFIQTTEQNNDIQVVCVYNPHLESAKQFAHKYQISQYTDNLQIFSKEIDGVYIATPHETHYAYTKEMLNNGKHILCEKPLTLKGWEAKEVYELAASKKRVLMEAIKTAYCPGFRALIEMAQNGKIGQIKDVEACFTRLTMTNVREMTDAQYGGSVTEMGSYVLLPIIKLLGTQYKNLEFKSILAENGIDTYSKIYLEYENGLGLGKTGLQVKAEGQLVIAGAKGYILAESPWWLTKKFEVRYEDPNKREVYTFPYDGTGLQYELEEFIKRIQGTGECVGISVAESIAMADVIETFLQDSHRTLCEENKKKNVKIWAHRGCSMAYPENTLEAFVDAAKIQGITGIELDVQLSKDGEVVVFHDENVGRVTVGDKDVSDYTLEELKTFAVCNDKSLNAKIPTLKEVLQTLKPFCENNGLLINIELKTSVKRYEGIEELTLELVKKYGLEPYIIYSSFLAESIKHIKELNPKAQTGMLCSSLTEGMKDAKRVNADAIHPWLGGMDSRITSEMTHMSIRAWGGEEPFYKDGRRLSDKDLREYASFGVTDIITNVPERYL